MTPEDQKPEGWEAEWLTRRAAILSQAEIDRKAHQLKWFRRGFRHGFFFGVGLVLALILLFACQTPSEFQKVVRANFRAASISDLRTAIAGQQWTVTSESMLPGWPVGTPYRVQPIDPREIRQGLPLVYLRRNGEIWMHAAEERDRWGNWIVQGTNNAYPDVERVNATNLLGVAVRIDGSRI